MVAGYNLYHVQGSAKRWALGCVNSPSAARVSQEAGFTQPRAHLLADSCSESNCDCNKFLLDTELPLARRRNRNAIQSDQRGQATQLIVACTWSGQ